MPNHLKGSALAAKARVTMSVCTGSALLAKAGVLDGLGVSGADVVAQAGDAAVKQRLREQTDRATELGIFGAPSFTVDGEIFWGNDRIDFVAEQSAD